MERYYLIAVSTRVNLDLCIRHALAGFTNSTNGIWAYVDIEEGDFVSFLYGARVFHLYRVRGKEALEEADQLPPWPPVYFRESKRTYYFPFRLHLERVRTFEESLVRMEFAYVAQNLLLRGGYAKTHFQADQTTLQEASKLGKAGPVLADPLKLSARTFLPHFVSSRSQVSAPNRFLLQENILHAAIKRYLSKPNNLTRVLDELGIRSLPVEQLEVLGERALPEGHVDILVKQAAPIGSDRKVVIEVKKPEAQLSDVDQLRAYMNLVDECEGGMIVAQNFGGRVLEKARAAEIGAFAYSFDGVSARKDYHFDELCDAFRLERAG